MQTARLYHQYAAPFELSTMWARVATRAYTADTPSTLAYVLARYAVCAHTAND